MNVNNGICPICKKKNVQIKTYEFTTKDIDCEVCGKFNCSFEFYEDFSTSNYPDKHFIQGAIREKNTIEIIPYLVREKVQKRNFYTIQELLESVNVPKTPLEKIDRLLLNLIKKSKDEQGKTMIVSHTSDYPLAYGKNPDELNFFLSSMNEKGFFMNYDGKNNVTALTLSLSAWERAREIERFNTESEQGFIACWFSPEHDKFRLAIEKGINRTGFKPLSIKDKNYPETILSKALGEIRRSRFIIVDLTAERKTVFVEWGFAMGQGVESILVMSEKYWTENKSNMEFYASNYNIQRYRDEQHLEEIVFRAISERIGLL